MTDALPTSLILSGLPEGAEVLCAYVLYEHGGQWNVSEQFARAMTVQERRNGARLLRWLADAVDVDTL
jgi:hypothetical protein